MGSLTNRVLAGHALSVAAGGNLAGRFPPGSIPANDQNQYGLATTLMSRVRGAALSAARDAWNTTARNAISSVDETLWFGPLQPIQPYAPQNVGVRQWDYPVGINIRYIPRQDSDGQAFPVATFDQLRFFSRNVDVVRILIETRKDQVSTFPWAIKFRDEKSHDDNDPRLKTLTDFFRYPDPIRKLNFRRWSRMLVEDMLSIDAASVYVHRDTGGKVIGLIPVDGSTIKPLVDGHGAPPVAPDPAYMQILHGVPATYLSTDDLVYYPRNPMPGSLYGLSPVEQLTTTLNLFARRQLYQLQWYTEANTPAGFLELPPDSTDQEQQSLQKWLDARMAGNTAERRRITVVKPGTKYTDIRAEVLTDKFDEWLTQLACGCFSISPQVFLFGRMNRASAQTARQQAREEGLAPLLVWMKDLLDYFISSYFNMPDLEWQWAPEPESDQLSQSTVDDKRIRNGTKTINEIRAMAGDDPQDGGDQSIIIVGNAAYKVADLDQLPAPGAPPQAPVGPDGEPVRPQIAGPNGTGPNGPKGDGKAKPGKNGKPGSKASPDAAGTLDDKAETGDFGKKKPEYFQLADGTRISRRYRDSINLNVL